MNKCEDCQSGYMLLGKPQCNKCKDPSNCLEFKLKEVYQKQIDEYKRNINR